MVQWLNSPTRWGRIARVLHWSVALLVVTMLGLGWAAELTEDRAASFALIRNHFQLGMLVFALMVMRVAWRVSTRVPARVPGEPAWREAIATAVHAVLYVLLLVMPISGYIIWVHMQADMTLFGMLRVPVLFTPDADDERLRAGAWYVHYYGQWSVIALVVLHVAAALWHDLVRRDATLARMARPLRGQAAPAR